MLGRIALLPIPLGIELLGQVSSGIPVDNRLGEGEVLQEWRDIGQFSAVLVRIAYRFVGLQMKIFSQYRERRDGCMISRVFEVKRRFRLRYPWSKALQWNAPAVIVLLCVITAAAAVSFKSLVTFTGSNGSTAVAGVAQGSDGNFYGTTNTGGANSAGTVFKLTPGGTLTTIYSFCALMNCADGELPYGGLVLGTDGNFYGTTQYGGSTGAGGMTGFGTVFRITKTGTMTVLHNFCTGDCSDGNHPIGNLIEGNDGHYYGAAVGGVNSYGGIFKITPGGTFTLLHGFTESDGSAPNGSLVLGTDGNFYGTTRAGGTNNRGTAFRMTPAGTLTTLYSFCNLTGCADGDAPYSGLIQASDGFFYGATTSGGSTGYGTAFKITAGGKLTTLHSFDATNEGYDPVGGVIQATDGNLYGATPEGGINGHGTLYQMTTGGSVTVLHNFDGTDGSGAVSAPTQSTGGAFFGTTNAGGNSEQNIGTVYRLANGLGAFVETVPVSDPVGGAVTILGSSLTGSTSVTFNGVAATFTVVSPTEIKTTVPTGATTGKVQVVTPGGTLTSNVNFRVR
jgi:uncharacterized repeat protein (TIGR03803 family)